MTAIFKCEYTSHKAVGIQWVAICEVFCIVTVYSECHRSPGNVPSASYALLHLIFNATLGDIEQAMLAPIYRHWNCGSESEAPIHNQGAVEIPGDPGPASLSSFTTPYRASVTGSCSSQHRKVQSQFWGMSIILSQGWGMNMTCWAGAYGAQGKKNTLQIISHKLKTKSEIPMTLFLLIGLRAQL